MADYDAVPAMKIVGQPTVASSLKISPVGGAKTVTTAGTGVALVASATPAQMLYVRAKNTNTNLVYVGDSSVDKDSSRQMALAANEAVAIAAASGYRLDIAEWYVDAVVNGEGVDFVYVA